MASELARAVTALIDLDRAARAASDHRFRLRAASEEFAAALLARLRVGATATVGPATYSVEQITWEVGRSDAGEPRTDPHGLPALLRDDHVLVAGTRKHGAIRLKQLPTPLARVPRSPHEPLAWTLHPATDEVRLRFAQEQHSVLTAFGAALREEAQSFDESTRELLAGLVDLLTEP